MSNRQAKYGGDMIVYVEFSLPSKGLSASKLSVRVWPKLALSGSKCEMKCHGDVDSNVGRVSQRTRERSISSRVRGLLSDAAHSRKKQRRKCQEKPLTKK